MGSYTSSTTFSQIIGSVATINVGTLVWRSSYQSRCQNFRLPIYLKYALRIWNLIHAIEIFVCQEYLNYSVVLAVILVISGSICAELNSSIAYSIYHITCSVSWFSSFHQIMMTEPGSIHEHLLDMRFILSATTSTAMIMRAQMGMTHDIIDVSLSSIGLTSLLLYLWFVERSILDLQTSSSIFFEPFKVGLMGIIPSRLRDFETSGYDFRIVVIVLMIPVHYMCLMLMWYLGTDAERNLSPDDYEQIDDSIEPSTISDCAADLRGVLQDWLNPIFAWLIPSYNSSTQANEAQSGEYRPGSLIKNTMKTQSSESATLQTNSNVDMNDASTRRNAVDANSQKEESKESAHQTNLASRPAPNPLKKKKKTANGQKDSTTTTTTPPISATQGPVTQKNSQDEKMDGLASVSGEETQNRVAEAGGSESVDEEMLQKRAELKARLLAGEPLTADLIEPSSPISSWWSTVSTILPSSVAQVQQALGLKGVGVGTAAQRNSNIKEKKKQQPLAPPTELPADLVEISMDEAIKLCDLNRGRE